MKNWLTKYIYQATNSLTECMKIYIKRMLREFIILLIIVNSSTKGEAQADPVITIKNGSIRGRYATTADKKTPYYAFQGIPYAEPPLGDLRFRPPKPPQNWQGIKDTTEDSAVCVQTNLENFSVIGSEDCLYLNVYTPDLTPKKLKPVMVWIHGGFFFFGGSNFNYSNPEYLLNEDVVVVALNYRLGVFGFLTTGDLVSPGNYGLKDQILALKWVRENIGAFGGDEDQVTIFGESAGGASVSYLLLSPAAKGLFSKAISESGCALDVWALARKSYEVTKLAAKLMFVYNDNPQVLVDGLRKADYRELQLVTSVTTYQQFVLAIAFGQIVYAPVIETPHEGAVITEKTREAYAKGNFNKARLLAGFTSNELGDYISIFNLLKPLLLEYDLDWTRLIPTDLELNDRGKRLQVGGMIKEFYFENNLVSLSGGNLTEYLNDITSTVFQYFNDNVFMRGINEMIKLHSKFAPAYYYVFSYESDPSKNPRGVSHGGELRYLFPQVDEKLKPEDLATSERLVKLWTNFAKFGDPTPNPDPILQNVKWPVANANGNGSLAYLNIGKSLEVGLDVRKREMVFWKGIYDTYGDPHDNPEVILLKV